MLVGSRAEWKHAGSKENGMNFLILGATGGTGLELVRRSLACGHSVTAFARSTVGLSEFASHINVCQGDVLDRSALANVIRGHDAVLSGFGPRVPIAKADANLLERFAIALTEAMEATEVRRLVFISTAFLFKDSIIPPTYLLGRMLFPSVVADSAKCERIIKRSRLDWTIVRPPQLIDQPPKGQYRIRIGHLPRFGFNIARADVADYFVQAAQDRSAIQKIVGVSN